MDLLSVCSEQAFGANSAAVRPRRRAVFDSPTWGKTASAMEQLESGEAFARHRRHTEERHCVCAQFCGRRRCARSPGGIEILVAQRSSAFSASSSEKLASLFITTCISVEWIATRGLETSKRWASKCVRSTWRKNWMPCASGPRARLRSARGMSATTNDFPSSVLTTPRLGTRVVNG